MPLYPNLAKQATFGDEGKLISGPVILKLDAGPGQIVADADSIKKSAEFKEKGLLIIMGLPNATAVQQEMDALYGPLKLATYACGERLVAEKLKARGAARQNGEVTKMLL